MRLALEVVVVATPALLAIACTRAPAGGPAEDASTVDSVAPDPPPEGACSGGGGGLPTPTCGTGACSCCVGCSQREGLCFDPGWGFSLGVGDCVALPAGGTLQATVGATAFAATEVAAAVDGGAMEISARAQAATLAFVAPAAVGDYDCTAPATILSFAYFDASAEYRNRPSLATRPACTVHVTSVGNVGERIEGSFAVSLVQNAQTPATLEITAGTFSVERVAYP